MKFWTGDIPIERTRDLMKNTEDSDCLTREDCEAIVGLLVHIMKDGKRLSQKEEYEWRTCGILKTGIYRGKERECIDIFYHEDNEEDEEDFPSDVEWQLALMLKDRRLRCVPDVDGDFKFFTNESYEEHLAYLKSRE